MVAMVIVLVGMLGMVQMMGITATENVKNQLRDEAVMLGEEHMAELFRLPEGSLPASQVVTAVSRLRGNSLNYTITRTAAKVASTSSYQMAVNVGWTYKGVPSQYQVQAMRTFAGGM